MILQPLRMALTHLTDAHFTGVCPRLEALPWLILPALMLTVLRVRAEQDQGDFRLAAMPGVGFSAP